MRDIMQELLPVYDAGQSFALATVVRTWHSAPRPVGAAMAVLETGEAIGSVSGGCVEGALYDVAREVIVTGEAQLVSYGVSDDSAFAVGLTCGGTIEIFVQCVNKKTFPEFAEIVSAIENGGNIAIATIIEPKEKVGSRISVTPQELAGSLGNRKLDYAVGEGARALLVHGSTRTLKFGPNGENRMDELSIFVESYSPAPKMIIFGAIDFAAALARIGKFMGYYVIVCDARSIFATKSRFPDADEVIVDWPHKYLPKVEIEPSTVICVLTHDPKFDVPVLEIALRTQARYIGAMGSRRTHDDRIKRLKEVGISDSELSKLKSPIGLDLGGRTPEETAVSIAAEIISSQIGGSNQSLSQILGPIHKQSLASEKD